MKAPDIVPADAPRPQLAARALAPIGRTGNLAWHAAGRGVIEFFNSSNLTFAASIAYYTLLSLFPFLLLVLSVLGRLSVIRGGSSGNVLQHLIDSALPSRFEFLVAQLQELATTPFKLTLVGTVVALWASMGVFGAIASAVNHAWGAEQSYGFFKHKLIAFLMMVTAGVLAMTAFGLVTVAQVVEAHWFSGALLRVPELGLLRKLAYRNAPTPIFILVVGLIYYFVPNAKVRLRDVWFGALLAGLLWRLTFAGFAWYLRDQSRFSVDGSVGAVVAFLVWVYLSAAILLYGVEVTAAYARLRQHLPHEVPAAPLRTG